MTESGATAPPGPPGGAQPAGPPAADAEEAARVTAFWRDLGLPGLVDIHTHFMPPNVLAKIWAFFDGGRAGAGRAWPIAYRRPEEERVALLRAFGVRRFSALLYPHKPDMAAWLNSWAAGFAARTPDALHSATFFPEPAAAGYVAEAIGAGARLFKAHLQVGGYDPRDDMLDAVWGMLAEAQVPVVVHCGSGPYPGAFTGPGPISGVLARHPRLTMIVAHLGAPEYGEFLDLAGRYRGVHLDTTMTFTGFLERLAPFPPALLPRLAATADRILLGTDFPNIPYPYLHQLEALARLDLGAPWLRAVCYGNAARLLGGEAGPGLAERGEAGSGLAERGVVGPGLAERGEAGSGLAERGEAGSGLAERGEAGSGLAERGEAGSGPAERGVVGPGPAERAAVGRTSRALGRGRPTQQDEPGGPLT